MRASAHTKQARLKLLRQRVAELRRRRYEDDTPITPPTERRRRPTERERLTIIDAYLLRRLSDEMPDKVLGFHWGTIHQWMNARGLYLGKLRDSKLNVGHPHASPVFGCPQCIQEAAC